MNTLINAIKTWVSDKTKADWSVNDETDPRYVKNKPFWTNTVEKTVLDSFTDTYSSDNDMWNTGNLPLFDLVRGATYTVLWDDVAYECVAVDDGYGGEALGNFAAVSGTPDSGEPFFIDKENNGEWCGICAKEPGTHTVSIIGTIDEVHKIDEKYLPEQKFPWLIITGGWDDDAQANLYSANMTYDKAVELFTSNSLLGGCIYGPEGIKPFTQIAYSDINNFIGVTSEYGTLMFNESKGVHVGGPM